MSVGAAGDGLSDDAASEDGDGLSDDAASEDGDGLSDDAVGYASDDASDGGGGGFDGDSGDELPDADDNGDEPSNIFQSNFDLDLYETGIAKVPLELELLCWKRLLNCLTGLQHTLEQARNPCLKCYIPNIIHYSQSITSYLTITGTYKHEFTVTYTCKIIIIIMESGIHA